MFVSAYGAEAATWPCGRRRRPGCSWGAGLLPKSFQHSRPCFHRRLSAKEPMTALVAGIPVKVVLNAEAALLGAAVRASDLAKSQ